MYRTPDQNCVLKLYHLCLPSLCTAPCVFELNIPVYAKIFKNSPLILPPFGASHQEALGRNQHLIFTCCKQNDIAMVLFCLSHHCKKSTCIKQKQVGLWIKKKLLKNINFICLLLESLLLLNSSLKHKCNLGYLNIYVKQFLWSSDPPSFQKHLCAITFLPLSNANCSGKPFSHLIVSHNL